MSIARLPSSLSTLRDLPVESSDDLVAEVQGPAGGGLAKIPALDSSSASAPERLVSRDCSPADALSTLGRVTAGPPAVTAALLGLAAGWPLARYCWAFPSAATTMELSPDTDGVNRHNRTTLSEHFGIAAACWLTERFLLPASSAAFGIADLDNVAEILTRGRYVVTSSSMQPDYIYFVADASGVITNALIVECKGTASRSGTTPRRRAARKQLVKGVQQVRSWDVPGIATKRYVFGSIIGPAPAEYRWTVHGLEVAAGPTAASAAGGAGAGAGRLVTLGDLVTASAVRQLRFAGLREAAHAIVREPGARQPSRLAVAEDRERLADLDFDGFWRLIATPMGDVEVFQGVERRLTAVTLDGERRTEALSTQLGAVGEELTALAEVLGSEDADHVPPTVDLRPSSDDADRRPVRVRRLGGDGCLTIVRTSPA